MSKKSNKSKPSSPYKHSFGHFKSEGEANTHRSDLQQQYPKKKFEVVLEKRQTKYWKKYCVCEFIVKQEKEGLKKVK